MSFVVVNVCGAGVGRLVLRIEPLLLLNLNYVSSSFVCELISENENNVWEMICNIIGIGNIHDCGTQRQMEECPKVER